MELVAVIRIGCRLVILLKNHLAVANLIIGLALLIFDLGIIYGIAVFVKKVG